VAFSITATDTNLALHMSGDRHPRPTEATCLPTRLTGITGPAGNPIQGALRIRSYIYVDLGQVDTIHSVVITLEIAAGCKLHDRISASGDPSVAANWNTIQNVTGNNTEASILTPAQCHGPLCADEWHDP